MTPNRFSALGLPDGPSMHIRLLGDRPSASPGFSKPMAALMQERSAARPSSRLPSQQRLHHLGK